MKWKLWLPLVAFLGLSALLAAGLRLNPHELPSPYIGKAAPEFSLPTLADPDRQIGAADLKGKVWVMNVWASWCTACREEHPFLVELERSGSVSIYGLNYKDENRAARDWLRRLGDPYLESLVDAKGAVGLDYGVYGVPETFVIDAAGVVRYKHVGPLNREVWAEKIEPLLQKLKG